MQPLDVKLRYRGQPWHTILVEVGHDEIGDADEAELLPVPVEVATMFEHLGFPVPAPVPLMPLKFQIAQKLHGLSAKGSDRVRDVIDLQLMAKTDLDLAALRVVCKKLFVYRRCQPWPPHVEKGENWETLYQSARGTLPVLSTVDEAILWANQFIAAIDHM